MPSNTKDSQKFDEYIKELLVENKKNNTLNQENVLKGIQDKVVIILAPSFKLQSTMEFEKKGYFRERIP